MHSMTRTTIRLVVILVGFLVLTGCQGTTVNFQTMLQNLASSYGDLWKLVTATAYVLGFALIMKALYQLKIYGEMRTMMSSNASIKTPLTYMFAGTMLIFSPEAFSVINMTLFATPSPIHWSDAHLKGWTAESTRAAIGMVQLIGLIAFVRGWLYIARAGDQGGQPVVGKGLTHIIGGVLAINILQFKDVLWATFGF